MSSSSPSLTIRIGADASGAIQGLNQTTQQLNNLNAATQTTSGGIILIGRAARETSSALSQMATNTQTSTSAVRSITAEMSRSAQTSQAWVTQLNNSTRAASQLNNELSQMPARAKAAENSFSSLKSILSGLIAMVGVSKLTSQMDEWASMEGRLKIVSNSMQELRDAQAGLSQIAQTTRTDLKETSTLYFKMAQALKETTATQSELLRITETTNKAIIISGAGYNEARNALIQFGQAMASNRLGGDELRSMAEQSPRLVMAIRDNLKTVDGRVGVTTAEFRKLAEAGYLTSDVMREALGRAATQIDKEFAQMPTTIGQSFTLLNNAMMEFVGKGGQTSGAAQGIASSIKFLAEHVTELAQAMTVAAGAFVAYELAVIAAEIKTALLTATMMRNPFVAVATAIGTTAGALYAFKDSTVTVGDNVVTVGSLVKSVWGNITGGIKGAISEIDQFIEKHQALKTIIGVFSSGGTQYDMRVNPIKDNAPQSPQLNQTDAWSDAFKGRKNDLGMQAKAMDDAKKVDQWLQESLEDDLLKGLRNSAPKIAPFVETDFDKIAESKLKKVSDYQKKIIEETASLKGVQAELIKAVVSVESAFKGSAESGAGAVGLMQMTPIAAKDIGATMSRMKDEAYSVQAGTEFLSKQLKVSGGDLAEAWARWNWGNKGVQDVKNSHGGAFDIQFAPPETRKSFAELEATLKALGLTVSEVEKPWKSLQKTVDESAKKQEQAAKKVANEQQKNYDSTAFGTAEKAMSDLEKQYSTGVMSMTEYQNEQDKIMATYEKDITPVVTLTKAQKELNKAFEQTPRGKFEKSTDELRTQKPFMSENDYANKQDKIGVSYLKDTGQNTQAKTQTEQATEAAKHYEEQIKKVTTANYELGNSSKMAFDGILGGVSSVAEAFTSFGDTMTKNADIFQGIQKDYEEKMTRQGVTLEQQKGYTEQFYKEKQKYVEASTVAEISGARSIAGATAQMFSEKSSARKAFHDIEIGLAVIEMAMSTKKMVVDVAGGAAAMFEQGGFAGFGGVAAMMAIMAGLGFAGTSSGLVKTIDTTTAQAPTTGTVAGDNTSSSKSIQNSMQMLVDLGAKQVVELKDLNTNFTSIMRNLNASTLELSKEALKIVPSTIAMKNTVSPTISTVNPLGSAGSIVGSLGTSVALGAVGTSAAALAGAAVAIDTVAGECTALGASAASLGAAATATAISVGASVGATAAAAELVGGALLGLGAGIILAAVQFGLGKLLGIGKTKYTAIGGSIITSAVEFTQAGMQEAMTTYDYSTIKATTKGWFSNTVRIYDIVNGINAEMTDTMTMLFQSIFTGLKDTFAGLKLNNFIDWNVIIPDLKLSTYGKTPDEINKLFSDVINNMSDQMATAMAGGLFSSFVKTGEGMVQTITRVASEVGVVTDGFHKLGLGLAGNALVTTTFADSMANLYQSMPGANDGLKNFTSAIDAFYNTILTKNQQVSLSLADYSTYAKDPKNANLNLPTNPFDLKATQVYSTTENLQNTATQSSQASQAIVNQGQIVQDAYAPQSVETFSKSQSDVAGTYKGWSPAAFQAAIGGDFSKASSATMSSVWLSKIEQLAQNSTDFAGLLTTIKSNDAKSAAAIPQAITLGYESMADYTAKLAAVQETDTSNNTILATQINNSPLYGGATDTQNSVKAINEEILAARTTAAATSLRAFNLAIIGMDNTFSTSGLLDPKTISLYDKFAATSIKNGTASQFLSDAQIKTISSTGVLASSLGITQFQLAYLKKSLDETAISAKNLGDAGKVLSNFSTSIDAWVKNMKVTTLGTPQSQMQVAQANFAQQMDIIKNSVDPQAKQTAMSGITSVADAYITTLKNYYGNNADAQTAIQSVISQVQALPDLIPVANLQLTVMQNLLAGQTNDLSPKLAKIADLIASDWNAVQANPTMSNQLKLSADAQFAMTVNNAVANGASDAFTTQLINSINSNTGIQANVSAIINDATLNSTQKSTIVNKLMTDFNSWMTGASAISFTKFTFDSTSVTQAAEAISKAAMIPVIPLTVVTPDTNKVVLSGLANNLLPFNNTTYNSVIEMNGTGATKTIENVSGSNAAMVADLSKTTALTLNGNPALSTIGTVTTSNNQMAATVSNPITVTIQGGAALATIQGLTAASNDLVNSLQAVKAAQDAAQVAALPSTGLTLSNPSVPLSVSGISTTNDFAINNSPTVVAQNPTINGSAGLSISNMPMFATGGAFTNGIVTQPTMFNMGLMGEAGSEGILPLININGSLGVNAILPAANDSDLSTTSIPNQNFSPIFVPQQQAANNSSSNNAETIAELKKTNEQLIKQNQQLTASIQVLQAGFKQLLDQGKSQTESLKSMESNARLQAKAGAKK